METSSPPRNRASYHLDPHLGTRADAPEPVGAGFPAFGCTEGSLAPGRLRAGRRPPNVLRRPRVPQEPERATARAPAAQPRSRGARAHPANT